MKILTRYVLREFLVPLGYCLSGFISIYVLFELFGSFSKMMGEALTIKLVVLYFAGYLSPYFQYLAPASLMLATLYTMWMFCRHSEIIAMRASGISFMTIVKPLLAVALVMAGVVVFVNEWFVPHYAQWAAQFKNERFDVSKIEKADNIVYRNSDNGRTWNIDQFADDDGYKLKNVKVTVDRPGGTRHTTILADAAEYLDGEWWFFGVKTQHYDPLGQEVATTTPELDAMPVRCFDNFRERPSDFVMQNRPWKYNSIRDRFRYIRTHPEITEDRRNELIYDTWSQIVSPWACLIITLFAIPAGIASGRQSVFKGILGALGMFFAFYGVTLMFMIIAKNNWINPILANIIPGAVFLVLGIRMFLKQR